jgi:hypothetical protein
MNAQQAARIWRWPIGLAILILSGLLSALLGQTTAWQTAAWTALTIPLLVIAFYIVKAAVRSF